MSQRYMLIKPLCQSVSDERRDRIIETKNRGDHVGLAIAY